MTVGYSVIESKEDLNAFIDGQHYDACKYARGIAPHVKRCFDCPFPVCVMEDIKVKNQFARVQYIAGLKQMALC